jgi:hypothetical protein
VQAPGSRNDDVRRPRHGATHTDGVVADAGMDEGRTRTSAARPSCANARSLSWWGEPRGRGPITARWEGYRRGMQGTYTRDVALSQAAGWRLTWGREGWRVSSSEPVPARRAQLGEDLLIRYTLTRTPDARHPPGIPGP